jgi:hypothetical protein
MWVLPCTALAVWPILWLLATRMPRASRPATVGLAALVGSAVAVGVALLVFAMARSAYLRGGATVRRSVLQAAAIVAVGAGGAGLYMNRLAPAAGWQFSAAYGLIAAPAVTACLFAAASAVDEIMWRYWRRTVESWAQFDILDDLLWLLHRLRAPGLRSASVRLVDAAILDRIAVKTQIYLLARRQKRSNLSVRPWLAGRTEGWAQAVRHLERGLLAGTSRATLASGSGSSGRYVGRSGAWPRANWAPCHGGNRRHQNRAPAGSRPGSSPPRARSLSQFCHSGPC